MHRLAFVTIVLALWSLLHVSAAPIDDVFGVERSLSLGNFSLTNRGTWLVEYYAPWCPHCRAFAPKWHELVQRVDFMAQETENPFTLARVDCVEEAELCGQEHITGYPSAKLYKNGKTVENNVFKIVSRDIDRLEEYIRNEFEATHPAFAKNAALNNAPSGSGSGSGALVPVTHLTEFGMRPIETIEQLNRYFGPDHGQGPSFVKYYSPSCPHCRAMAHDFELAAREMVGQVNPIAVNCQKYSDVCAEHDVGGWPHMRLMNDGNSIVYPDFGREKDDFLNWLREQNVLDAVRPVDSKSWFKKIKMKKQSVLHLMPQSDLEVQLLDEVKSRVKTDMQFLVSSDRTLSRRFGDSGAILVFNDNPYRPMAKLPLSSITLNIDQGTADTVARWLDMQNEPLLLELTGPDAGESLHQDPPTVLAALSSEKSATVLELQLQQLRSVAQSWRSSPDLSRQPLRFRWFDVDGREANPLKVIYDIDVKSVPSLYLVAGALGTPYKYPKSSRWIKQDKVIKWLNDVQAGRVANGLDDSLLARTLSVGSATEEVNPVLIVLVVIAILCVIPRTRRFLLRLFSGTRANRKIV